MLFSLLNFREKCKILKRLLFTTRYHFLFYNLRHNKNISIISKENDGDISLCFQNWYKSQSRYRTKKDREKDALLEEATITMPEMAQLLGTTRSSVYAILDNPKYSHFFEFIVIAEKKRITKESFQKFLEGQDRYKLDPSNDYEELAQEQNIALDNFRRKKLSQTGIRGSNGNIKYLTFDEASYLAKVSRSMINKWADKGKFTVIKVGSRVRIRRDEFEDWMEQRDLERSMQYDMNYRIFQQILGGM